MVRESVFERVLPAETRRRRSQPEGLGKRATGWCGGSEVRRGLKSSKDRGEGSVARAE